MERNGYSSAHKKHHHKREESGTQQQNLNSALFGNLNLGSLANIVNSIDVNELVSSINSNIIAAGENGENNEIAAALKTLINCDKAELVQVLLKFYALRKPVKK